MLGHMTDEALADEERFLTDRLAAVRAERQQRAKAFSISKWGQQGSDAFELAWRAVWNQPSPIRSLFLVDQP